MVWLIPELLPYHFFGTFTYLLSPYFDRIVMDSKRNLGQKTNTSKYQHEITKVHKQARSFDTIT